MIERICIQILDKIKAHPNEARACEVIMDIIDRINLGESVESIKTQYRTDLEAMLEENKV